MSRVVVVGLGYVGLPLAVRAAQAGHRVFGLDLDPAKIEALQAGRTYVEDVSSQELQDVLADGAFHVSANPAPDMLHFDVGIIVVPTPLRDGEPDLSCVEAAGRTLGRFLRRGSTVVLESTTYPGTTEGLLAEVLEEESGLKAGHDFHLGFSPERIDPGNKVNTLVNTPKLVSATTPTGLAAVQAFYDTVVERTVPVSNPRTAEITKLFENIQANTNIALVNEMAELCRLLGIDVWEVVEASMTKGHSMARWTPGPGVGGHCLPIDPIYLAWLAREELGRPFRFAELAQQVNEERPVLVAERAAELVENAGGRSVLVLGTAYKPNVGDVRESPAVEVVRQMQARALDVTVVDPHVDRWTLSPVLSLEEMIPSLPSFDLVVLVTDHDDFDYEKIASEARLVLDCRHAVPASSNVVRL
ncbi:nucleotide sugar dehydrogenase [Paenibacillus sp. TRM 82003]|uniref:nucleotide sugar dehydrogenase n=1 Tax=Kineococcus sp. TRM81007 TaxID=2925831 RepID=UPI001F57336D|nr:nucleotide sugar dehydrogenase [Kineococcus sp. TRM81007]MCI2239949.1 nucleotide sugar dehydrogenase [Kineococcus sp. TRM81007]MCI3925746.1 nucleotide sugar dehydrogenase [Paenibacillus sp. TRM 82003]